MNIISLPTLTGGGPSAADLAAIEDEWPLIAAELDLLDAEIAAVMSDGSASAMDRRRVRRAERRVLAATRELADESTGFGADDLVAS